MFVIVLAAAWENGTLAELEKTNRVIRFSRLTPRIEQYLLDKKSAAAKGFDSIFDEFDHATNAYKMAEKQEVSYTSSLINDLELRTLRVCEYALNGATMYVA